MENKDKLIADWIGTRLKKSSGDQQWALPFCDGYWPTLKTMKFRSSWDWLMPVIERIQSLDDTFIVKLGTDTMSNLGLISQYNYCHIENWKGDEVVGHSGGDKLIQLTYKTIVAFIEWHVDRRLEIERFGN